MNKIYLDILSKAEILAEGISKNAKELATKNIHINTDKILSMRKELDYSGINVPLVAVCNVPPVAQCNVPPQKWLQ